MIGRLVAIGAVLGLGLGLLVAPAAEAATADAATADASPGPYLVGEPITFTSTTPCTVSCRLIWTFVNGTRLGDALGEGTGVTTSFATPGPKTVELRLTELCAGTSRLVCSSVAVVTIDVEARAPAEDTTAPTFEVSGTETEATGPSTPVNYAFSANDPDDAVVAQFCAPAPGSAFPVGTSPITCTATDAHGNVGTEHFGVTVTDSTPPALTVPGAITAEATSPEGATVDFVATAGDLVDGAITPACSRASGSTFPLGSTTITCTASDAHGNTSSASFDVVVDDTTPPVLALPGPITVSATSPAGAVVSYTATASDVVDGTVTARCAPASGSLFPIGTTAVICTATDARGNTSGAHAFSMRVRSRRHSSSG